MFRVEIIANHSVEDNILEAFVEEGVGKFYTKYPNIFGVGSSGPRMGDAVWPEENFSLVLWCEEEEAQGVARAVAAVKSHFPDEGIRIFGLPEQTDRFSQGPAHYAFVDEPSSKHTGPGLVPYTPEAHTPPETYIPPETYTPPATYTPPVQPQFPTDVPVMPAAPAAPPAHSLPLNYPPASAPPAPPPVYQPPSSAPPPVYQPAPGIGTEYDGQNMDEEH